MRDSAPDNLQSPISNLQKELRAFLKEKLPDYMIPSAFVTLESLPLTPSGKVDRRALPDPDRAHADPGTPYVAPSTPVEETLAQIWTEVLGVERIGMHDNFFALGGHSLFAAQVMTRVRKAFLVELPLRTLFAEPTLDGLAEAILQCAIEQADDDMLAQMMAELDDLEAEPA